jgi:hypothetical protein
VLDELARGYLSRPRRAADAGDDVDDRRRAGHGDRDRGGGEA